MLAVDISERKNLYVWRYRRIHWYKRSCTHRGLCNELFSSGYSICACTSGGEQKWIAYRKQHFGTPTLMQQLLESEGVKIINNQIQDFEKIRWKPKGKIL